jgi:hypothetical protein
MNTHKGGSPTYLFYEIQSSGQFNFKFRNLCFMAICCQAQQSVKTTHLTNVRTTYLQQNHGANWHKKGIHLSADITRLSEI